MSRTLTILVPTWNRVKYLEKLVPQILKTLDSHPQIDAVISNNGSTDETRGYLDGLSKHARLRIVHQSINLGADIHIAWLYGQSDAEYLWMVGDDDWFIDEIPNIILKAIASHPGVAWIHLPGTYHFLDGSQVQTVCPENEIFADKARQLLPKYVSWAGWVTANVLRTDAVHRVLPKIRLKTIWWPHYLLMKAVYAEPAMVLPVRGLSSGPEITWSEVRDEAVIRDLPSMILDCEFLSRDERRECLEVRYAELPQELISLFKIDLPLAIRCCLLLGIGSLRVLARGLKRKLAGRLKRERQPR